MSTTNNIALKFEGSQITFFPNGHRMRIANFKNGIPIGDVIEYYPNGKLYNIRNYNKKEQFLKQYNDSTGKVLTENGNGTWVNFLDETFNKNYIKGKVKDGFEEGDWRGEIGDDYFAGIFIKGKLMSSSRISKHINAMRKDSTEFRPIDETPEFPGGIETFMKFLAKNIHYPPQARQNNTQGRVIVSFVVNKNGSLSDIKIARGIGDGCDEEALRVIKLSPPWNPGMQSGKPVSVSYSVPIVFSLLNRTY